MIDSYQHQWQDGEPIEHACSKIVCVGKNYADHIKEMNSATPAQPVLFIKPPSALCDANAPIKISHLEHLGALHHELEISLLIGDEHSKNYFDTVVPIAGIGVGLDLTLRDIQTQLKTQGLPWERAKSFDGSCVLSAFTKIDDSIQLDKISLELSVNDSLRQKSDSSYMLCAIPYLLQEINSVFTLLPGDVVLTGTPAGVGPLYRGDIISAKLNGHSMILKSTVI